MSNWAGRECRQAYGLTIRVAAAHGVPLDLDDVSGLVDGLGVFGLGSHDLVVDFEDEIPRREPGLGGDTSGDHLGHHQSVAVVFLGPNAEGAFFRRVRFGRRRWGRKSWNPRGSPPGER